MSRPTWDEYFMGFARQAATRSTCDRLHVGAVIVSPDQHILATGYNGAPRGLPSCDDIGHDLVWIGGAAVIEAVHNNVTDGASRVDYEGAVDNLTEDLRRAWALDPPRQSCLRTLHAEANALLQAARVGTCVRDARLYTTAAPCLDCAKLIINSGIRAVYYAAPYSSARSGRTDLATLFATADVTLTYQEGWLSE